MERTQRRLIVVTACVLCFVYLYPILSNFFYWGQYEWDQYIFHAAVQRKTILFFKQFPLWNNYSNGGNLMLAHPYSSFLSLVFLPILFFGPIAGSKIAIIIFSIIGILGMLKLARNFNLTPLGSLLAGIIYIFNGYFALQIKMGRLAEFSALCLFPWFLMCYLKSLENRKYFIFSVLILTLILLGGSTDIIGGTMLFLLSFSVIASLIEKRTLYLRRALLISLAAISLSAIKIIPSSVFIYRYLMPDNFSFTITVSILPTLLFGRNQIYYEQNVISYWTECASYIGIYAFLLSLFGFFTREKKRVALLLSGIFFLLLVLDSPLNLWHLVRKLPFYRFQYATCRYIIFFVFTLSMAGGFGFDFIKNKLTRLFSDKSRIGIIVLLPFCLLMVIDYFMVNQPILKRTFINPPVRVKEAKNFIQRANNSSHYFERSAMYPVFLMNNGIVNSYERVSIDKGKISTKYFDNLIPMRWKVHDFVFQASKEELKTYIQNTENNSLQGSEIGCEWDIIQPTQGLDGRHLSYRFSLLNPQATYFDVIPSGENSQWHVFYVLFYVYSPGEEEGLSMELGGASDICMWLNEIKILDERSGEVLRREGKKVDFSLHQGWNKMLFRAIEIVGGFKDSALGFSRIEKKGKVIDSISYDVLREFEPHQAVEHEYKREAYLEKNSDVVDIVYFSPNKIQITLFTTSEDRLIINQNFHNGWRAKNNLKVEPYNGLISVKVPPGASNIELYFLPKDFLVGALISLFGLTSLIMVAVNIKRYNL